MANIVDIEYYGYPNRETYDMVLNLGSEYDTQKHLEDMGQAFDHDYEFAEYIEEWFESFADFDEGRYRAIRDDVGSLWRVDWESVANHFMEE